MWDLRSSKSSSCVQTPGKVYSLSVIGFKVVVATSERHILIYDVRFVFGSRYSSAEIHF